MKALRGIIAAGILLATVGVAEAAEYDKWTPHATTVDRSVPGITVESIEPQPGDVEGGACGGAGGVWRKDGSGLSCMDRQWERDHQRAPAPNGLVEDTPEQSAAYQREHSQAHTAWLLAWMFLAYFAGPLLVVWYGAWGGYRLLGVLGGILGVTGGLVGYVIVLGWAFQVLG